MANAIENVSRKRSTENKIEIKRNYGLCQTIRKYNNKYIIYVFDIKNIEFEDCKKKKIRKFSWSVLVFFLIIFFILRD